MSKNNFIVPKIKPILSSNYNKKIIRPLFSVLDNDKLSKEFNLNIEKWQLSLKYIYLILYERKLYGDISSVTPKFILLLSAIIFYSLIELN